MSVTDELMEIERRLAHGRGETYDEVLHQNALVIVPGAVLDKRGCVEAMNSSPGWDETHFGPARTVRSEATATVVYAFTGRRGDWTYTATLASTYVRDGGRWQMLLHQQTPA